MSSVSSFRPSPLFPLSPSSPSCPCLVRPTVPPSSLALAPVASRRIGAAMTAMMAALAGLLATALPAGAHVLGGPMGGFGSGFEHPLLGADHFLAMLAVGLWGAQMGGRSVWTLPATFPLIMCVGGIGGMLAAVPDRAIAIGIALSLVALGAAIASAWRAPEWASLSIITLFALFHGYPHGKLVPNAGDPAAYTVGFVVATGAIHLAGIGIGYGLGRLYGGWLVRGLGGLIAAAGAIYLVLA